MKLGEDLEQRAARLFGDDCSPGVEPEGLSTAYVEQLIAADDPYWGRLADAMARKCKAIEAGEESSRSSDLRATPPDSV